MNNFNIDNYDKLKKIANFIGDPSDLVTEDKTIVGAINEISEGGGGGSLVYVILEQTVTVTNDGAAVAVVESELSEDVVYIMKLVEQGNENAPCYYTMFYSEEDGIGTYEVAGITPQITLSDNVWTLFGIDEGVWTISAVIGF